MEIFADEPDENTVGKGLTLRPHVTCLSTYMAYGEFLMRRNQPE